MLLFGGYPIVALAVVSALVVQVAYFSITLWLSVWTGHANEDNYAAKATSYLLIYVGTVLAFVTFQFTNNFIFQRGGWKAAQTMHGRLVTAVLQAPISWFDSNPVGRIVNRFGLDTQSMDSVLVDWLRMTLDNGLRFALRLVSNNHQLSPLPLLMLHPKLLSHTKTFVGKHRGNNASLCPTSRFLLSHWFRYWRSVRTCTNINQASLRCELLSRVLSLQRHLVGDRCH